MRVFPYNSIICIFLEKKQKHAIRCCTRVALHAQVCRSNRSQDYFSTRPILLTRLLSSPLPRLYKHTQVSRHLSWSLLFEFPLESPAVTIHYPGGEEQWRCPRLRISSLPIPSSSSGVLSLLSVRLCHSHYGVPRVEIPFVLQQVAQSVRQEGKEASLRVGG